ncbi:MAG: FAD-dependent oxidoreductase [Anaerolineae bacterium]
MLGEFEALFGEECGSVTTGLVVLAGAEHAAGLQQAVQSARAVGLEAHLLTPAEFAALEPGRERGQPVGHLLCTREGLC